MKTKQRRLITLFTLCVPLLCAVASSGNVTITRTATITAAQAAGGVAVAPDGSKLYVAFWEDQNGSRIQECRLPDELKIKT